MDPRLRGAERRCATGDGDACMEVLQGRIRAGLIPPRNLVWAEALLWKPAKGRLDHRGRRGRVVGPAALVPYEEQLRALVEGPSAQRWAPDEPVPLRWHLADGETASEHRFMHYVLPDMGFDVFEAGGAHGPYQLQAYDAPAPVEEQQLDMLVRLYMSEVQGRNDELPFIELLAWRDTAVWWHVSRLAHQGQASALAVFLLLLQHNPLEAWRVFRGWMKKNNDRGSTRAWKAELDQSVRGLVSTLLGGPPL